MVSTAGLPVSETKTSFAFLFGEKYHRKDNAIHKG
jgi:hypothetical protein